MQYDRMSFKAGLCPFYQHGDRQGLLHSNPCNRFCCGNSITYGHHNSLLWYVFRDDPAVKGR